MTKRENYKAYMAEYMLKRYHEKRKTIIANLGGICVKCGAVNDLEIDHIKASSKELAINKQWSQATEIITKEVKKCQLLCKSCHTLKTIADKGHSVAKGTHGTLSAYRYCKCPLCKKAKSDYNRIWKEKKKNGAVGEI